MKKWTGAYVADAKCDYQMIPVKDMMGKVNQNFDGHKVVMDLQGKSSFIVADFPFRHFVHGVVAEAPKESLDVLL